MRAITKLTTLLILATTGIATAQNAPSADARAAWTHAIRKAYEKDPSRDAAGGVDGVIDGGFAFHTSKELAPWWQVDLAESDPLDRIVIFNRVGLWERARTITVHLSDDGNTWNEVYRHDGSEFYGHEKGEPLTVALDGESARYVRLWLREETMFHLDEVQIFGTGTPDTNIALNKFATQSTTSPHSSFKPLTEDATYATPADDLRHAGRIVSGLLDQIGAAAKPMRTRLAQLVGDQKPIQDAQWITLFDKARLRRDRLARARVQMRLFDAEALRLAAADLTESFGDRYAGAADYRRQLEGIEAKAAAVRAELEQGTDEVLDRAERIIAIQRKVLLANPLLDFDELLIVRRANTGPRTGLPQNWQGNCALPRTGYDDAICRMSSFRDRPQLDTLYKPERNVFVGDVDLHFDADRLLFSSLDDDHRWQVFEIGIDGGNLRQVTSGPITETDNYDACYLPDGRIVFASAAVCQGVPCVGGADAVSNLYIMGDDGKNVRQLCFDQDHNWHPTVLPDGGVLFARWEYTDTPHYFTRLLMRMNPDGTSQMPVYGSNSYWPNSIFYSRPIPGHPSKLVTVVSGHHGVPRMGELIVLDTAKGTHEADGVVQRIPGRGKKVEPIIVDQLVDDSWPKFLQPWPLSEKYFLVSCKPAPDSHWGIYLVDVFDNMVLLHEERGQALLEPVPLVKRERPPVIPDRVRPDRTDATVYMADVYNGPGLAGVPRGDIKALRVIEWHYGYNEIGGHQHAAVEGGWDVKRILGTVPVEADGSALFTVPANTPLAVQPINDRGEALQLMRSWFTAMPGEMLSCVGCHEAPNTTVPNRRTVATAYRPRQIAPWHGPTRGFSFTREVQPVLDRKCVACHDGNPRDDEPALPNFADNARGWGGFTKSYLELHPYVRRPGPESDYHLLRPAEFRANTSELVQMLRKGHHNVQLSQVEWDRLITWIDFNVPDHGTWTEHVGSRGFEKSYAMRLRYRKLFANIEDDPEAIVRIDTPKAEPVTPAPVNRKPAAAVQCNGWPFDADEALRRQQAAGPATRRTLDLGDGVTMDLVLIPAGQYVMGDEYGDADEAPTSAVTIDEPFWMGTLEVTNRQFIRFDAEHDSGYYDQRWKDHTTPGYPANLPDQPVIRVTWRQARAFCQWLSKETGESFALPTEAQWEYAARAGTATRLSYGGLDTDFSKLANMADASTSKLVVQGVNPQPVKDPDPRSDYLPKDARFDDGHRVVANVGTFQPNAWGLHDMHGNVAEWTQSTYQPYPYADDDRNNNAANGERVVRGGSWRDRPKRCRSAFRLHYPDWQPVFNVGFRVICPVDKRTASRK